VKLVDTNILLYSVNSAAAHHPRVRKWWEATLAEDEPVGMTWITILGFIRVATRPGVFARPLPIATALALVHQWLEHPRVRIVQETEEHWRIFSELVRQTGAAGNLTSDAHLATVAISYGASVCSCDADFGRYPKLRWENPLF
jgi:toxin-antitoxin system PIN domain toxin